MFNVAVNSLWRGQPNIRGHSVFTFGHLFPMAAANDNMVLLQVTVRKRVRLILSAGYPPKGDNNDALVFPEVDYYETKLT